MRPMNPMFLFCNLFKGSDSLHLNTICTPLDVLVDIVSCARFDDHGTIQLSSSMNR
jgi:hypothetical protein